MDQWSNKMHSCILANEQMMLQQLHELCSINSGSTNLSGLATMHHSLRLLFEPWSDKIETKVLAQVPMIDMAGNSLLQPCGDALFIQKRPELKRRILLCGHMDTVYDANHSFQQLTQINPNQIQGPGVADMKGGLLVMLHALMAFEQTPLAQQVGWDVLINADEEIGSPASSSLLKQLSPHYQAGLVYEPSMTANGLFAKHRKGSGKLTLIAAGKAAHAGRNFDEGRNAICYLATIITAIDGLNHLRDGVTINIGLISGGSALNVVPDNAVAKLDIRIKQPEDEIWVREQLNLIKLQMADPDYSLLIHGSFERPVKYINQPTQQLFKRIQTVGKTLGLTLDWQDSGGCCDGNNLAAAGMPVIDTLGVRGGNIHSAQEYILLDSLVERATLSALILSDLAQGGLELL